MRDLQADVPARLPLLTPMMRTTEAHTDVPAEASASETMTATQAHSHSPLTFTSNLYQFNPRLYQFNLYLQVNLYLIFIFNHYL
eukprot:g6549.t1